MNEPFNQILADLAATDNDLLALYVKRRKLADILELYGIPIPDAPRGVIPSPPTPEHLKPVSIGESATAKARITGHAAAILSNDGQMHTRDILRVLKERYGIEPGGSDKVLALSGLLSKDERFVSDRANGWALKKEGL